MGRYVLTRVVSAVPVLFGVSVVIFLLMHIIPGDVTTTLLGPMATEQSKALLRKALGLDEPLLLQYVKWLSTVLAGNFGTSIATSVAVSKLVLPKFVNTAILAFSSLVFALAVGYGVGIAAAARPRSLFDRITMSATLVLGSIPPYWLALILVLIFALSLRWLPATGMQGIVDGGGVLDVLRHLILPSIATGAGPAAIITRMVRASMLEIKGQDYIRVVRARGVPRGRILRRHVLKNALPPIATITGLQLGYLLGGALFTEVVFAWPGLGNQLYSSIIARDIPVVQAAVLLIALIFVVVNLLVDLLNAFLDPRVRVA